MCILKHVLFSTRAVGLLSYCIAGDPTRLTCLEV